MKKQILHISTIFIFLASCTVGKDYKKPEFVVNDKFSAISQDLEKIDFATLSSDENLAKWWNNFNDPLLSELIHEAIQNNKDLAIAIERVNEVKAQKKVVAGAYYPEISASGSGSRQKSSNYGNSVNKGETDSFDTDLDASWEIDIFGKTKRAVEAAKANIDIENEIKHGVLLSITAELASSYFEVRGLQRKINFTKQTILLLKETEKLATDQFKAGIVTELDINLAKGERQEFEANLPTLEAQMMAGIYRISILTGQAPEAQISKLKDFKQIALPSDLVPVGLRSDILRRRPDIRQAERNLAAKTAYVGVAKGALYPSFSITGGLGSGASRISDLFTAGSGFYSIGSIIDWDILQGGALRANISAAESGEKQAQLNYEQSILLALEDVESALIKYGKEWQVLSKLKKAEKTRKESFQIAKYRYEEGVEDFQTILDAERTLITTQEKVIVSETKILTYLTQIYKSLGGGWKPA